MRRFFDSVFDESSLVNSGMVDNEKMYLSIGRWSATGALNAAKFEPPSVYQGVCQVSQDIELIRDIKERPKLEVPTRVVEHVEPRHDYYQAQTNS